MNHRNDAGSDNSERETDSPSLSRPILIGQGRTLGQPPAPDERAAAAPGPLSGRPYQIFLVPRVPRARSGTHNATFTWCGTASAGHEVVMSVWDPWQGKWQDIERVSAGNIDQADQAEVAATDRLEISVPLEIPGPPGGENAPAVDNEGQTGSVVFAVTAVDPFTVRDAGDDNQVTGKFAAVDDYDFAVAVLPDTQYYTEGAVRPSNDEATRARFASAYHRQLEWLIDHADEHKIAYIAHIGDLVQNWFLPGYNTRKQARREFEFASEAQAVLDDSAIPNGVQPGNHDNLFGLDQNVLYNAFFGPERYEKAARHWKGGRYGGPWRQGDNSSHLDFFTVEDGEFMAVHLGFGHTAAARAWVNQVLAEHRDKKAILFTHAYLAKSMQPDGHGNTVGGSDARNGAEHVRDQIVNRPENSNLLAVISGHYDGIAWNINRELAGRPVFEMLADYQDYKVNGEKATGFFRLLQFSLQRGEIRVNTYSPHLGEHGATDYDANSQRNYLTSVDEFTVPVNLGRPAVLIDTESVAVADGRD